MRFKTAVRASIWLFGLLQCASARIEFPFSLYETSLAEGSGPQTDFFSVKIQTSSPVHYQMTSLIDSRSQRMFSIDEQTGDISTVSDIDREFMNVHYFKVIGVQDTTEDGRQTATTTLQISIKDVNDNAPEFENQVYNASVQESLPIGSSIVTVRASDADADDNGRVSYSLVGQDAAFFRIDANSGVLTLRANLDREKHTKLTVGVIASDNGIPASERLKSNATIIVNLLDDNDNIPAFSRRTYYMDVLEDVNAAKKPIVGRVVATDLDAGENAVVKYSIIGGNTGGAFAMDPESGDIYLQKGLDREKQDSFKLIIRAQDLGDPPKSNTTQVVINVLDVNDNEPRFPSTSYYQSVAENVPEGYSVLQVTAFDPDQGLNSKIGYSIRDPSPDLPFDVDKTTGWIHTTRTLDREIAGSYRFYVEAKDQGSPRSRSAISTVQISVLDRNDNDPVMSQRNYDIVVSESEPLGSEILKVVATDPDENSEIRYDIVGGNVANAFSISSRRDVGIISIAQPLDYNKEKFYRLSVNAVDSGGRFATASVNINVTDSNNHSPNFENTPYIVDVFEDTPVGSTVLVLYASDLDHGRNAKINYRLQSPSETFHVERDTGALVVSSTIDRESVTTYILTVIAEDSGLSPMSDRTQVEISIVDVNDNAPRFPSAHYHGSVHENVPAGTRILEVSAHDEDLGENGKVRYRFVAQNKDEQLFTIDPVSGIIRTKRPLDREAREYYDLMVEAYDAGIPEMSAVVKVGITILDLNDNPPFFNNDTLIFNLPENLPSGSKVGTIYVTDPDVGANSEVRFKLLNSTVDAQYFFIDDSSSAGSTVLYTRKEFDYEVDRREYTLLLRAESEPLRTDAVVLVQLADVNDNHPIIQDFDIIFNQRPDEFFPHPIGHVPATDADPTSNLFYNFTYGNTANLLQLDASTGAIRLSPSLKSNVNVVARVGVSVSDGKNEARANLRLRLNHVTDKMLEEAVTLRVANMTARQFLVPFFDYLVEGLSVIVPCQKNQINIFSLKDDSEDPSVQVLNVTFSVSVAGTHDESYMASDFIKQRVFLHDDLLRKLLLLDTLPFDDNICVREPCLNFEQCSSRMRLAVKGEVGTDLASDRLLVPQAQETLLFRSVDPLLTYHCHCPVGYTGMKNRYTCDTKIDLCYSSPCHSTATCISRENGYVCLCPPGRAGRHCHINKAADTKCSASLCHKPATCAPLIDGGLTCRNCSDNPFNDDSCRLRARSFTSDTYAAFPALKQRDEFNITLSFATQQPRGVLFYNGRLNNENDFVSLEIRDKSLVFQFHTGAPNEGPVEVSLSRHNGGFSDGQFHRVEVRYSNESATIVVGENCDEKLALKYGHKLTEPYLCANQTKHVRLHSQCGFYSGRCVRLLDLSGPFLLGGMGTGHHGFVGCMKDLHIDQQTINLADMVHNNGSIAGCPEKRDFCLSNPCKNGGTCLNGWGSYQCICDKQWTGKNCGNPAGRTFGFKSGSELGYRQELSPIQLPWQMGLEAKTRQLEANFTLLTVKMGNEETYKIQVRQGIVYYLHDEEILLNSDLYGVADGMWHDITVKWMKDEVWLNIDYGQYERTQRSHHSVGGKVVTKITVGDSGDKQNHLDGCVRNFKIGMGESENPSISYEKGLGECTNKCTTQECYQKEKDLAGFCPFENEDCLADPCDLNLCADGSRCQSSSNGYSCACPSAPTIDRYCTPKEEELCPSHWWGKPVCGPCQCNVSQGFNESCSLDTGACSCKANHYIRGGRCIPCNCYSYGSVSPQCDTETGACKCQPGVSGQKCDKCSHGFAELTSTGCQVIYGVCPAEFSPQGIWWPRSVFGEMPNATCPQNAIGMAKRPCTKTGWGKTDLSGCIHQEFIVISNHLNSPDQESWLIVKRTKEAIQSGEVAYTRNQFFQKDVEAVKNSVLTVFKNEAKAQGFQLAHKKDRDFLENFVSVLAWLLGKEEETVTLNDIHLITAISVYGQTLASSMDSTFTNPFEVVTSNIIFGLDELGTLGQTSTSRRLRRDLSSAVSQLKLPFRQVTRIPKYNNYIKSHSSWSKTVAEIVSDDDQARFNYASVRGHKNRVQREHLLVPQLLWGTNVHLFSDIFSVAVIKKDDGNIMVNQDMVELPKPQVRSVIFKNTLTSPSNRLHCVLWDRDLWNAIDCETIATESPVEAGVFVVNCSCSAHHKPNKVIIAALEEFITDGHDYLSSQEESIVFSICSAVSMAVLLMTAGCLTVLNYRRKTSTRIHRNIVICIACVQLLSLVVILANTQLIAMPFLCTFTTMALHYSSVATFVWIAVESVHIYRMLSELRDINHGKTTFYSAAGFGLPGLVVGLTMGVSGNNYGSATFCWLSYSHSSVWGMIGPEAVCALVHLVTMSLNLSTVFKVKSDLEDFGTLRSVFFVNACLLPLVTGFHVTSLLMINDRQPVIIYTYAVISVVLSLYLMGGFLLCDKSMMRALSQCTGNSKKSSMDPVGGGRAGTNVAMSTRHISRSSLSYGQRGKQYNQTNNLDAGAEVSVASTTSQSTYQTSSKFKSSHLDEPDHDRYYHGSDSETDIDRRSLDLASSINSSDEDMYDPSDLKHLSVNDYPQY